MLKSNTDMKTERHPKFTIQLWNREDVIMFQKLCKIMQLKNYTGIEVAYLDAYRADRTVGEQVTFNDWTWGNGLEFDYLFNDDLDPVEPPYEVLKLETDFVEILSRVGFEPLEVITFKLREEIKYATAV